MWICLVWSASNFAVGQHKVAIYEIYNRIRCFYAASAFYDRVL